MNSRLESAYALPGVDWSRYEKILVATLDVSDIHIVQPRTDTLNRPVEFALDDVDRELLQGLYAQAMYKQVFEKAGHAEARLPGPATLMLRVAITELAPNAPKDNRESRGASGATFYTKGAGSVSIKGILQDGESGEVLAYFNDTRDGSPFMGRNTRRKNRQQLSNIFNEWAELFVQRLDELNTRSR